MNAEQISSFKLCSLLFPFQMQLLAPAGRNNGTMQSIEITTLFTDAKRKELKNNHNVIDIIIKNSNSTISDSK